MTMTVTIWWLSSGVWIYQIVTGVTSVVGMPSTHLVDITTTIAIFIIIIIIDYQSLSILIIIIIIITIIIIIIICVLTKHIDKIR